MSGQRSENSRARRGVVTTAIVAFAVAGGVTAFAVPNALDRFTPADRSRNRSEAATSGAQAPPSVTGPGRSPEPVPVPTGQPAVPARNSPTESSEEPKKARCAVSDKLVPSCGVYWGVTPGAFTSTPRARALHEFERKIGRPVDIYHAFHRGHQLFPTREDIAIAREPGKKRLLLLNWKPDVGRSWASVADGSMDGHIKKLSAHVKRNFPEKFFLVIHHEPEEEVRPEPGSGYTATDFRNMFRHVVMRLRAEGVTNALFVPVFMGSQKWGVQPWFDQLYPGGDVVDWVGYDPYAEPKTRDFAHMVNKTADPSGSRSRGQAGSYEGFYKWSAKIAPGKPLMIAEWGVFSTTDPMRKPTFFEGVADQLKDHPRVKALVYFESPHAPRGDTRIDSNRASLAAFRRLGNDPRVNP